MFVHMLYKFSNIFCIFAYLVQVAYIKEDKTFL